jgi:hypothetical protein
MITNIPTQTDYQNTALGLLNLAWENTLDLAVSLEDAKDNSDHSISEKDYWDAGQSQLTTAASLVQQALEFLLKARIISISPYLLINGTPRDWPKDSNSKDTPFAQFYSIDAQDLIRTHDTVANTRLPENIKSLFEKMRTLRNTIMHTVDNSLKVEAKQVVCSILEILEWSAGSCKWIETRREYIGKSPKAFAYDPTWAYEEIQLAREILKAVDILQPSEVSRFFGFDKKQRRYICPSCSLDCGNYGFLPNLAFLIPNTPESINLHCYLCEKDFALIRKDCVKEGCKGNVILDDGDYERNCLTCNWTQ